MSEEREWHAALALNLVDKKNYSTRRALDSLSRMKLNALERATSYALIIETIRRMNIINRLINDAIRKIRIKKTNELNSIKNLKDPKLKNLLRIFVYRLKFEGHAPEFVFNTSKIILLSKNYHFYVELFDKWLKSISLLKLDQFLNEISDPIEKLSLTYNQTYYLSKKFFEQFKSNTESILRYLQHSSPVYIRINSLKSISSVYDEFELEGVTIEKDLIMSDVFKIVNSKIPVARLNGFKKGNFYIQSRSSCLISYLLDPAENELILDSCAAPGSKTSHMASLTNNNSKIYAVEVNEKRFEILSSTLSRLNVNCVTPVLGDATSQLPIPEGILFDKILIDAPCSGSGSIATNPHTKWRINKQLVTKYSKFQDKIINNISKYVKNDGILLYSTCSLLKEENENIISNFLENNNEFKPINLKYDKIGQKIEFKGKRLIPHELDSEGFSIFLMKKEI